jgi:hypothetical protein
MLKPLADLEELNLSITEITPATLEFIPEFKKLKKLLINNCIQVSPDAKETLQKAMPGLKIDGP